MEDNEIIGALDEKIQLESKCYQEYLDNGGLKDLTAEKDIEILCQIKEFINRQKAENERLKVALEFKCDSCENIKLSRKEYWTVILQAKSEARKEFAERLKEKFKHCNKDDVFSVVAFIGAIDGALEEMENENERERKLKPQ